MSSLEDLLLAAGALNEAQVREGRALMRNKQIGLADALLELRLVDEVTLGRALAKEQGMPFVDLSKGSIAADVLERVPGEMAREQGILPIMVRGDELIVAVDDPLKKIVADQLEFTLGCSVRCALTTRSGLARALREAYGAGPGEAASLGGLDADDDGDAPIIRLATRIFQEALKQRASDIHLEPTGSGLRVRYRVDGVLRESAVHPPHLAAPLTSRIKIMGQMDIAEKRKPQDGRISMRVDGRDIDVRASILPTNHGETVVLRLLDKSANLIGLRELGFDAADKAWFSKLIERPNGIVLVTGPTGSGKTTTLYAALSELNRPDVKIITAEDPVEYHLAGINQVQVHAKIGLTFGRILKAMLRAAPNVILVGEIRDLETAEIAIQAALTGHLVFSTLHTNDAVSALTRLQDMGVQPFLVSTAIQGVVAQRLVRELCSCAETYQAHPEELRSIGLDPVALGEVELRRPRGCRECEGAGYRGRFGLFELFEMDNDLRERTFRRESLESIRSAALGRGRLRPLVQDGARKVLEGRTSVAEVLRVTRMTHESS